MSVMSEGWTCVFTEIFFIVHMSMGWIYIISTTSRSSSRAHFLLVFVFV